MCANIYTNIIFMNSGSANLNEGCIRQLYTANSCQAKQPILQLIDFQQSEANEKQISIRISDGLHFVDCTLSGNYQIAHNSIVQTKNAVAAASFPRLAVIRLVDFFSKNDPSKICKLKIIIRKISEQTISQTLIGSPQEIQQFMANSRKPSQAQGIDKTQKKSMKSAEERQVYVGSKYEEKDVKIENVIDVESQQMPTAVRTNKKEPSFSNQNGSSAINQPLTLMQIMSGKEGFLIGRLIRLKTTLKQTKDGPMTVCYLGMLDKHGELIRIHLAGRLAMTNQKLLKRNRCYFIRGFDIVYVKNSGNQIRLKEKQYKIAQIMNQQLTRSLSGEYFHWDHESNVQNEYVDVFGIVDDIQQKTTYSPHNPQDVKSVIRVVVKNKFKSVRISFWTDHIKTLEGFKLKKKDVIIIEDVRKKQSKYYDYCFQSYLMQLSNFPFLLQKYSHFLPEPTQQIEPQNIQQLFNFYEKQPNDNKLHTLAAYLSHCQDYKMVYRFCDDCKKKVQRSAMQCHQCGGENMCFKYNCTLQFADSSASLTGILFDNVAHKLIGRTANQISQLPEQQIKSIFQNLYFRQYQLNIQYRNQRIIIRSVELMTSQQQEQSTKDNLNRVNQFIDNQSIIYS